MGMNSVWNILPVYLLEIVKTNFLVGVITSVYSLTRGFGFLIGRLGDRFGKDRTLAASSLLLVFLALALALTKNIFGIVALISGIGVLMTALYPCIGAGAARGGKKGSAFSRIEVSYQIGFVIGPVVGGFLAFYDMAYAFAFWAVCAFAAFLVSTGNGTKELRKASEFSPVAKSRKYLSFLVSTGLLLGLIDAAKSLLVPLWLHKLGYSTLDIGIAFAVPAVATIAVLPWFGAHSDRNGRHGSSRIGFVLMSAAALLLAFSSSLYPIIAAMVLLVLGRNISLFNGRAYLTEREDSVEILGLHDSFFTAGRTIGLFLFGFLADYFSMQSIFFIPFALGLLGLVFMRGDGIAK